MRSVGWRPREGQSAWGTEPKGTQSKTRSLRGQRAVALTQTAASGAVTGSGVRVKEPGFEVGSVARGRPPAGRKGRRRPACLSNSGDECGVAASCPVDTRPALQMSAPDLNPLPVPANLRPDSPTSHRL